MVDYARIASDAKAKWDAKCARHESLYTLFEDLKLILQTEVDAANVALRRENLPSIMLQIEKDSVELNYAFKCTISLDLKECLIVATFLGETVRRQLTFSDQGDHQGERTNDAATSSKRYVDMNAKGIAEVIVQSMIEAH